MKFDSRPILSAPLSGADITKKRRLSRVGAVAFVLLAIAATYGVCWALDFPSPIDDGARAFFLAVVLLTAFCLTAPIPFYLWSKYSLLPEDQCGELNWLWQKGPEYEQYRQNVLGFGRKFYKVDYIVLKDYQNKLFFWEFDQRHNASRVVEERKLYRPYLVKTEEN